MANGDFYDARQYAWQLRGLDGNKVMVRYDHEITDNNKGRYNTSPVVAVKTKDGEVLFKTQSGSRYVFKVGKCAHPMQLLKLTLMFGVEF